MEGEVIRFGTGNVPLPLELMLLGFSEKPVSCFSRSRSVTGLQRGNPRLQGEDVQSAFLTFGRSMSLLQQYVFLNERRE